MFSNMWMCMCLCMQCSRVYRCHFSVLSSDVWASSLLLWLRAEAPHRGHRFLLRQLCLQAAVQPEVSLQRAHASTQHVRRRHGQEDQGVPLTPPGAGEQLSYLSDTARDYAHLSTVSFLLPVKMKPMQALIQPHAISRLALQFQSVCVKLRKAQWVEITWL